MKDPGRDVGVALRLVLILLAIGLPNSIAFSQEAPAPRREAVMKLFRRQADRHGAGLDSRWHGLDRSSDSPFSCFSLRSFGCCQHGSGLRIRRGEARRLAVELFRVYGVALEQDVVLDTWYGRARIDGLHRSRKIGFELAGHFFPGDAGEFSRSFFSMFHGGATADQIDVEDDPEHLSEDELGGLRLAGWRILRGEQVDYWTEADDDGLQMLVWGMSIVDFLNDVTDGEDVVLSEVHPRFGEGRNTELVHRRLDFDSSSLNPESFVENEDWVCLGLDAATVVVFDSRVRKGLATVPERPGDTEVPEARPGARQRFLQISVDHHGAFDGLAHIAILQEKAGRTRVAGQGSGCIVELSLAFDENADFRVVATLPAGIYRISRRALLIQVTELRDRLAPGPGGFGSVDWPIAPLSRSWRRAPRDD